MRIESYLPAISGSLHGIASRSSAEACGVLTRDGRLVELPNRSADPESTFDLGPLHELEESEAEIAAIWHTHPSDSPPSTADVDGCRVTFYPWIIAGPGKVWVIYPESRQLTGRDFVYGADDCWAIVSDWYAQEKGVHFPWFHRPPDGWWKTPGLSPYVYAAMAYGFDLPTLEERGYQDLRVGDVLLMKVLGYRENHVAVYVGGGMILHHMYGQLSRVELLDGRYQRFTTNIARLQ
jgi:cell wall-associated NlpC family hydrolase